MRTHLHSLLRLIFCWNSHSGVFQSRQNECLAWLPDSGTIWNGTSTSSIKERPLQHRVPSSPDSFHQKGLLAPQCCHAFRISRLFRKPSHVITNSRDVNWCEDLQLKRTGPSSTKFLAATSVPHTAPITWGNHTLRSARFPPQPAAVFSSPLTVLVMAPRPSP